MRRRLLRIFTLLLFFLCLTFWTSSYFLDTSIGYKNQDSATLFSGHGLLAYSFWAQVPPHEAPPPQPFLSRWLFQNSPVYSVGRFHLPVISDHQTLGFTFQRNLPLRIDLNDPPFFMAFPEVTGHSTLITLPWWFPTALSALLLILTWRRTRPPRKSFPIEPNSAPA